MRRRDALSGIAGAALLLWSGRVGQAMAARADGRGAAVAQADRVRVRPGHLVHLRCPDADAFALSCAGLPTLIVDARRGQARVRAPWPSEVEGDWATLRAVPLRDGRPCGEPVEVQVLATPVLFGA